MTFEEVMGDVVRGFELAGVAILAIGSVIAGVNAETPKTRPAAGPSDMLPSTIRSR